MSRAGALLPLLGFVKRHELDTPDLQLVSGRQARLVDPLSVDESAVRALEIANLQLAGAGHSQSTVDARHQGLFHHEVCGARPSDRADATGQDPERLIGLATVDGSKDPHAKILAH